MTFPNCGLDVFFKIILVSLYTIVYTCATNCSCVYIIINLQLCNLIIGIIGLISTDLTSEFVPSLTSHSISFANSVV